MASSASSRTPRTHLLLWRRTSALICWCLFLGATATRLFYAMLPSSTRTLHHPPSHLSAAAVKDVSLVIPCHASGRGRKVAGAGRAGATHRFPTAQAEWRAAASQYAVPPHFRRLNTVQQHMRKGAPRTSCLMWGKSAWHVTTRTLLLAHMLPCRFFGQDCPPPSLQLPPFTTCPSLPPASPP